MRLKRLLKEAFPPPRRPVTWRSVLPLGAFLVVFGAACATLDRGRILVFTTPGAFLLTAVVPWLWWMHTAGFSGLRAGRSLLALMTRLCVAGVFIILLAGPRAVRQSTVLSVVYVLDVSDSIGEGPSDDALGYITETFSRKPQKHQAGLVVFGRNAAVELPPGMSFPLDEFEAINSQVATDGTDLGKGLSLAAAVLPQEHLGRIVLISDGAQTEGALSGVLDELKSREIPVDVVRIRYEYEHEVWLEKLELPRFVKAGETYEASVVLSSLSAGSGRLVLRENGVAVYEGEVEFNAGKNRYLLPLYLREPGYYEYVATIEAPPDRDGWQENNKAVGHIYLEGEGKILLVTDRGGDERDWLSLLEALLKARFVVDQRPADEFPRDPLSLLPYDCVILPNVPADALDVVQMQALHDAVYNQGVGFLMVGGPNSFGPGGYHRTAIEKALPVSMDISQKKVLPKGALVIVLHTCEFPEGNAWGKRIAKEAIRVLGAKDEVGILVHDWQGGGEIWLFELTPAGEYERLFTLINQAQIGDMPTFAVTMQMGLDGLEASDAAVKHMIIISDGDPSPAPLELLRDFVRAGISVSTVPIFPHPGQDLSLMALIAKATGGRDYPPQDDPTRLPAIFIKEAKTLKRSMVQPETFTPQVEAPSPILKGIERVPELGGYVLTTAKGRALTILKGPETEQVDPVLATWRYGLGKSAAFTSDLSPGWGAAWVEWDRYLPFVKQLVTDISRTQREAHLHVRSFAAGSTGFIVVDDFHPEDSLLEIEATVTGPDGRRQTVRLKQVGPRRYEGRFPLRGKGRYQIVGVGVGGGRNERILGGFVVPYSPEYLRFRADPIALAQIAQQTGGRLLDGNAAQDDIFVTDGKSKASSRSIADLFLVILACLIPLDVGVRRIQLDWALVRGWLGVGREAPSDATLQALLKRKEALRLAAPVEEVRGRPQAGRARAPQPSEEKKRPAARVTTAEAKQEDPAPDGLTTTQRLLARRKKWKKED